MGPPPRQQPVFHGYLSAFDQYSRYFFWFLAHLVLFSCLACAPRRTPDLLNIDSLGPSVLEAESEILILGSGFPEGQLGTLFLEGTAYAPARDPESIRWSFPMTADSRGSIVIRLQQRALQEQLKGAAHMTFRGNARIEFAPVLAGRPPLKGSKQELVLDFFSRGRQPLKASADFTEFLGMNVADDLTIVELTEEGIARSAGLEAGDKLHVLDGVRLDSVRDLLPQARAATSVIEYSRAGYRGRATAHIDRAEFQILDYQVAARAVATIAAVVLALLVVSRPPRFLLWVFGRRPKAPRDGFQLLADVPGRHQVIAYPIFVLVALAVWWMAGAGHEVPQDLLLLIFLAGGGLFLSISSFLLGGSSTKDGRFSLIHAFSATLMRLLIFSPIVLATIGRATEVKSLKLHEITIAQGTWPKDWGLFASPWSFLLGLSFLLALVPLCGRRAPLEGYIGAKIPGMLIARASEWSGQLILMGLWLSLYGGSNWNADWSAQAGISIIVKLALLAQLVNWFRLRSGGVRQGESWSLFGGANLALAFGGTLLSLGFSLSRLSDENSELLGLFALTLGGACLLLLSVGIQRSWAHMGRRIDPWI